MPITLSWDLIVIIFFAVIVAYSFIVGKDESVKIIIASYIATVAVQAIGNLLNMLSIQSSTVTSFLGFGLDPNVVSIVKLVLFVCMIIFLSIRGGFDMQYNKQIGGVWDPVITAACGFVTAGLLLSALLTYVAAKPLLDGSLAFAPLLQPLLSGSTLVQFMVDWQYVWFSIPAVLIMVVGYIDSRSTN
jgi:hypothetical protein